MSNRFIAIKDMIMTDAMTKHSIMMLAFSLLGILLNYIYQLAIGWLLTPEDYGIVISLLSLLVIFSVFSITIDTTITKFVSKESARNKLEKVHYLWRFALKRTFLLGLAIFIVLALLTPVISRFLNSGNNWYPIILFFSLVLTFALQANFGTLRGLQRFWELGISGSLLVFLKLIIATVLIYMGFRVSGALLALTLSCVIVFFLSTYFLRDLFTAGSEKVKVSGVRSYTGFTFLVLLAFTMLTNVDVILAKHYLSAVDAGNYSAISVMGKVPFFVPGAIAIVMFPKTSQLFEMGGAHSSVLRKAMLLTSLLAGGVVIIYGVFPQFIINVLFLGKYSTTSPYLFRYGLAMAFFAVSNLLIFYFLSLNRTMVAYPLLGAMLVQVILIVLFHNNIDQIVSIMLLSSVICLMLMLFFYLRMRNDISHNARIQ